MDHGSEVVSSDADVALMDESHVSRPIPLGLLGFDVEARWSPSAIPRLFMADLRGNRACREMGFERGHDREEDVIVHQVMCAKRCISR